MYRALQESSLGKSYRSFDDALNSEVISGVQKVSDVQHRTISEYDIESIGVSVIGLSADGEYFVHVTNEEFIDIATRYCHNN